MIYLDYKISTLDLIAWLWDQFIYEIIHISNKGKLDLNQAEFKAFHLHV